MISKQTLIDSLEFQLANLANEWRKEHSQGHYQQGELIVKSYHKTMANLWELGWDGTGLLPDSELPNELMPDYFVKKWGS
jgi:hypothetical protein